MRTQISARVVRAVFLVATAVWLASDTWPCRGAEATTVDAIITSPRPDEAVSRLHEVTGRLAIAGRPLLLVRPASEGGEWYVQAPPAVNGEGFFRANVQFGNEKTANGQKFLLTVAVLRNAADAACFQGNERLGRIPDGVIHSEAIAVVLNDTSAAAKGETAAVVLDPAANAVVRTASLVAGKLTAKGAPVVLVRCDKPNEPWWVQGPLEFRKQGEFMCAVRFGNDATPAGQKFRIVVLAVPAERLAESYRIGLRLPRLPRDVPCSEEVVVTLGRRGTELSLHQPGD